MWLFTQHSYFINYLLSDFYFMSMFRKTFSSDRKSTEEPRYKMYLSAAFKSIIW